MLGGISMTNLFITSYQLGEQRSDVLRLFDVLRLLDIFSLIQSILLVIPMAP